MKTKQTVLIGAIVLILVFMAQNTQIAGINFLLWNLSMPIILLIAIVLVTGIGIGVYLGGNRKV